MMQLLTISKIYRTMIDNVRPVNSKKKKKLNPTEKKVNKILSNENAREILKAHAITAINSQVRTVELWTPHGGAAGDMLETRQGHQM